MPVFGPPKESSNTLLTFLDPFNEYDREEYVLEKFSSINPNDDNSFRIVFEREFFDWADTWNDRTFAERVIDVKRRLAQQLIDALSNPETDFRYVVEDNDGTFGLPHWWKIESYRRVFETIYAALYSRWSVELHADGLDLPLPAGGSDASVSIRKER